MGETFFKKFWYFILGETGGPGRVLFIWPINEHSPGTVLDTGGTGENKASRNLCPHGTSSGEKRKQ